MMQATGTSDVTDRPLRILHISERAWPVGGCERMLRDTCSLLRQQGHAVHVAVADDGWTGEDAGAAFGVPVSTLPRSRGVRSLRDVRPAIDALLEKVQPDVIHLHNLQDFVSPWLLPRLQARAPTVRYVHDARLFCPAQRSKWLARGDRPCNHPAGARCLVHCFPFDSGDGHWRSPGDLLLRRAHLAAARGLDGLLVGSAYMLDQLVLNGCDRSRIHLLHGFTDRRPAPHAAEPASVAEGVPHLLAIGRFDGIKGLEGLPDLLAGLRAPRWKATVVGTGPALDATRLRAAGLGLAGRVAFPGAIDADALDRSYASADVVLVPTHVAEAFGLVGVEAMAHGKPVVAYALGGVVEWLRDGQTGLLAPAGDATAFRAAIDRLLESPSLAASLGEQGRRDVDLLFRPEHHVMRLLEVYRPLVATRAGAPRAQA
jgi:glycosyltransferase involved in cell wall biosynthesis